MIWVYLLLLLCLMMMLTSLALAKVKDLFAVVTLLSVFSGIVSLIYALVGAADVAFTEAVVGAGVSTIFMMALIHHVNPNEHTYRHLAHRIAMIVISFVIGGFLLYGVMMLPPFGDETSRPSQHVGRQFMIRAYAEMKTPNEVTAVLGDFRSFDTMIEAAVVLTAALGCMIILAANKDRKKDHVEDLLK